MDSRLQSAVDMLSASFDPVQIANAVIAASDAELHGLFSFKTSMTEGELQTFVLKIKLEKGGTKTQRYTERTVSLEVDHKRPVRENVEAVLGCKELNYIERSLFYLKISEFLHQDDLAYFLARSIEMNDGKQNGAGPWERPLLHEIAPIIALEAFRHSQNVEVRAGAARMLAKEHCYLSSDFVCRELCKRIADEHEVRKEVAKSLGSYGKYALPALCGLLFSGHKFTKNAALDSIMQISARDAKEGIADEGALRNLRKAGFGAHAVEIEIAAGGNAEDFVAELCSLLSSKNPITGYKACDLLAAGEKGRMRAGHDLDEGVMWRMDAAGFSTRADELRKLFARFVQKLDFIAAANMQETRVVKVGEPRGKLVA